jgi:hypothetical protein
MSDSASAGYTIPSRQPNCLKCAHFRVTWEALLPRACDMFAIKCANLPSQEVFRATGAHCPAFRQKEGIK